MFAQLYNYAAMGAVRATTGESTHGAGRYILAFQLYGNRQQVKQ
ncbi:MAG: hypothetical protein RLN59_03230 [Haliea sp.]